MNRQEDLPLLQILAQSAQATMIYTSHELAVGFASRGALDLLGHQTLPAASTLADLLPDAKHAGLCELLADVWQEGIAFRLPAWPIALQDSANTVTKYVNLALYPQLDSAGHTIAMLQEAYLVDNQLTNPEPQETFDDRLEKWSHTLSHDLRNPLSVAKLGMQYMQSRKSMTPEEQAKWVAVVIDAIHNLETLITDTVALNRSDARRSAPVAGSAMAHMFRKLFAYTAAGYREVDANGIKYQTLESVSLDAVSLHKICALFVACVLAIAKGNAKARIVLSSVREATETIYSAAIHGLASADVSTIVGWSVLRSSVAAAGVELSYKIEKNDVTTLFLHFPY